MIKIRRFLVVVFFVFLCVASLGFGIAAAAGTVVGSGTPISCTEEALRTAVQQGGLITFDCGGPATIFLQDHLALGIGANTIIDGGGQVTISGDNATRLIFIAPGFELETRNITLTNGYVDGPGGAIHIGPTAVYKAVNTTIQDSRAGGYSGGALYAEEDSQIYLDQVLIQGNRTSRYGGAVNSTGWVNISHSVLRDNTAELGGGALSVGGEVDISNSELSGNRSANSTNDTADGGALYVTGTGVVSITGSTIEANTAQNSGAGIYNLGQTTINRSTISDNHGTSIGSLGGGFFSTKDGNALAIQITNSAVTDNVAREGAAGYMTGGSAIFENVTISGNSALNSGGLTGFDSNIKLTHVTFSNNFGQNAANLLLFSSAATVQNSAFNHLRESGLTGPNCNLSPIGKISLGHNLASDDSCAPMLTAGSDRNDEPAMLGPLANNGGPTWSHMPIPGSLLIDGGVCLGGQFAWDQRGAPRPAGNACDIGAVEYGAPAWPLYLPTVIK